MRSSGKPQVTMLKICGKFAKEPIYNESIIAKNPQGREIHEKICRARLPSFINSSNSLSLQQLLTVEARLARLGARNESTVIFSFSPSSPAQRQGMAAMAVRASTSSPGGTAIRRRRDARVSRISPSGLHSSPRRSCPSTQSAGCRPG
jgi:hypothetical protein